VNEVDKRELLTFIELAERATATEVVAWGAGRANAAEIVGWSVIRNSPTLTKVALENGIMLNRYRLEVIFSDGSVAIGTGADPTEALKRLQASLRMITKARQ
jgi:hypothetical protein